jgi:hypothetical protein
MYKHASRATACWVITGRWAASDAKTYLIVVRSAAVWGGWRVESDQVASHPDHGILRASRLAPSGGP